MARSKGNCYRFSGFVGLSGTAKIVILAIIFAWANRAQAAPPSVSAVASRLDQLLQEEVFGPAPESKLAPKANDEAFLRRVYLDTVGVNPSPTEICAFVLDGASDKRAKISTQLVSDPRYGRNWGRYWRDV